MESGFRAPWVELFRRGEVDLDVRLDAARGHLAPRAPEQLTLLVHLSGDPDATVADTARQTLAGVARDRIAAVLGRPDAPAELREFFEALGIAADPLGEVDADAPLVDRSSPPAVALDDEGAALDPESATPRPGAMQKIAALGVPQRLALAMKGRREERAILIRDPNKLVALAVLSSPKLTETEVESFARMTSVAEDVPRTIAATRSWVKSYSICLALVRNPKTPLAVSMNLLARLHDRDLRALSTDRNVPDVLRATARRKVVFEKR